MARLLDLRSLTDDGELLHRVPPATTCVSSRSDEEALAALQAIQMSGDAAIWSHLGNLGPVVPEELKVSAQDCESALAELAPLVREALEASAAALRSFHRHGEVEDVAYEADGVTIAPRRQQARRVGLVLKPGDVSQASTVLAVTIAARVAGVEQVVISVEPQRNGARRQIVLAAAALAGVDEVLALDHVAASGALAFGSESIESADVLCGAADILAQAGPLASDTPLRMLRMSSSALRPVLLIDRSAPSQVVCGDVVAANSMFSNDVCVVAWEQDVLTALEEQLQSIPTPESAEETLTPPRWQPVLVRDQLQAAAVVNAYRPDQVQLLLAKPEDFARTLNLDAAVLVGTATSPGVVASFGGPGVVSVQTPGGSIRGLRPDDFRCNASTISLSGDALLRVASHAVALAEAEGDVARADSIRRRVGN